jgi:hypothetical protein
MAGFTVRIEPSDIAQELVRVTTCDWMTEKRGWISIYLDAGSVFMGDYDESCVTVARALAAQLTAAADKLEALLPAPVEPATPIETPVAEPVAIADADIPF